MGAGGDSAQVRVNGNPADTARYGPRLTGGGTIAQATAAGAQPSSPQFRVTSGAPRIPFQDASAPSVVATPSVPSQPTQNQATDTPLRPGESFRSSDDRPLPTGPLPPTPAVPSTIPNPNWTRGAARFVSNPAADPGSDLTNPQANMLASLGRGRGARPSTEGIVAGRARAGAEDAQNNVMNASPQYAAPTPPKAMVTVR
jgi:hypothetical protein